MEGYNDDDNMWEYVAQIGFMKSSIQTPAKFTRKSENLKSQGMIKQNDPVVTYLESLNDKDQEDQTVIE